MLELRDSEMVSAIPDVQPSLYLRRGAANSAFGHTAHRIERMYREAKNCSAGLGAVGALGEGNQGARKRPPRTWAGKGQGVRAPECDETPLSAEEVEHGLWRGCIR